MQPTNPLLTWLSAPGSPPTCSVCSFSPGRSWPISTDRYSQARRHNMSALLRAQNQEGSTVCIMKEENGGSPGTSRSPATRWPCTWWPSRPWRSSAPRAGGATRRRWPAPEGSSGCRWAAPSAAPPCAPAAHSPGGWDETWAKSTARISVHVPTGRHGRK